MDVSLVGILALLTRTVHGGGEGPFDQIGFSSAAQPLSLQSSGISESAYPGSHILCTLISRVVECWLPCPVGPQHISLLLWPMKIQHTTFSWAARVLGAQ